MIFLKMKMGKEIEEKNIIFEIYPVLEFGTLTQNINYTVSGKSLHRFHSKKLLPF